jgi:hypothetical protein
MPEANVFERVRAWGAERRVRPATIERWTALADDDAEALLGLATRLRLGENQLRDLWDWLGEVALRDGVSLATLLAGTALQDPFMRGLGRADELKVFKGALRRLRFPGLAAQEAQLAGLIARLGLPSSVRVEWPDFLEGDHLSISIDVRSPDALRTVAQALVAAAALPECAQIFALLDGAEA